MNIYVGWCCLLQVYVGESKDPALTFYPGILEVDTYDFPLMLVIGITIPCAVLCIAGIILLVWWYLYVCSYLILTWQYEYDK